MTKNKKINHWYKFKSNLHERASNRFEIVPLGHFTQVDECAPKAKPFRAALFDFSCEYISVNEEIVIR